jgi:hypothetical protein
METTIAGFQQKINLSFEVVARSGPWRPGFPVDGDQHFQSMTTTCSG